MHYSPPPRAFLFTHAPTAANGAAMSSTMIKSISTKPTRTRGAVLGVLTV